MAKPRRGARSNATTNINLAWTVPTKRGEIFFLDRRTGQPITRVEERPVPQGAATGERASATQPFSTGLPSFGGPRPTEAGMWGLTPIDQAMCRIRFREARFEGGRHADRVDKIRALERGGRR